MNIHHLSRLLFLSIKQAGIVARNMQEGILNEGKEIDRQACEDNDHYEMRRAKTKVDELVQELLLQTLYPQLHSCTTLDVEEDTPFLHRYPMQDHRYTLIIDPIDGTLPYINQKDSYSICVGFMHHHEFLIAMVYFPARDMLYAYEQGQGCFYYPQASLQAYEERSVLQAASIKTASKLIYKNHRLSQKMETRLQQMGYHVLDDRTIGCPDALLACLHRKAFAYLGVTRNLRDILLAVIIRQLPTGSAYDFRGNTLQWVCGGRQPECLISCYDTTEFWRQLQCFQEDITPTENEQVQE